MTETPPLPDDTPRPISPLRKFAGLFAILAVSVVCGGVAIYLQGGAPEIESPSLLSAAAMVVIGAGFVFLGVVFYGLTLGTNALTFRYHRPFFRAWRFRFWLLKLFTELFLQTGFAWICAPTLLVFLARILPGPAGTIVAFGLPFILAQFLLVWLDLFTPLAPAIIARRMTAQNLSPAHFPGGIPIGISDPAKSTMKKFLLVEEDLGLLWFTPTHLTYRGDNAAWDVAREDLLHIERKADPGAVSAYFGAVHVILHVRQPDAATRQIRLHPQSSWTLTRTARALDHLARQIESWRQHSPVQPTIDSNP